MKQGNWDQQDAEEHPVITVYALHGQCQRHTGCPYWYSSSVLGEHVIGLEAAGAHASQLLLQGLDLVLGLVLLCL